MIFFTADTHFGHDEIRKLVRRPFDSIEEMDRTLIDNWNSVVQPTDIVYHLGDFAFNNHAEYADRLNGHIILITGNHDKTHHLPFNCCTEFRGTLEGRYFHMYHYPLMSWDNSHRGSIHLYGHMHGQLDFLPFRGIDVGVDSWNYTPISLDAVVKAYQQKQLGEAHLEGHTYIRSEESRNASLVFTRAGGDQVCHCGQKYYDHPQHSTAKWLNVLCDGRFVKL